MVWSRNHAEAQSSNLPLYLKYHFTGAGRHEQDQKSTVLRAPTNTLITEIFTILLNAAPGPSTKEYSNNQVGFWFGLVKLVDQWFEKYTRQFSGTLSPEACLEVSPTLLYVFMLKSISIA